MVINTDPDKIADIITRGVEKVYPSVAALEDVLLSGKKIKLYCGYDPTAPTLHLGHLITLKKLSRFQQLGHEVIMLVGDFTGMIGDPTEKLSTRRRLTRKEVLNNSRRYKKIASHFLDFKGDNPARILFNSTWLDKIKFDRLIELAANFTVQQLMVRDFFQERIAKKSPIFLHEFLYPLAQAYDSVAMDIDLEVGGRDQTFNMLCGRDLMKILKNKEKFVLPLKLLTDPTGKKMGKSEGNLVSLEASPGEIFGKVMSWPDTLLEAGFELLTDVPSAEIKEMIKKTKNKTVNPRDVKKRLAREIVTACHDQKAAFSAEKEFERIFKEKQLPADMPEFSIKTSFLDILDLLQKIRLAPSRSEAKRLILQKAVKIDGRLQTDWEKPVQIKKEMVIQAGKRKFAKII